MGSIQNTVHYCCVSRDNQILYAYNNGGDQRNNESLALLCLEKTPSFHKWYFETINKRTFGFLIEDGFVYFAIVDEVFRRSSVLDFLEKFRDELKKANRKNSRGSFSGSISFSNVQDQLVRRLIASLETDLTCLPLSSPSIDGTEQQSDAANSTKAPLLGRSNKQEKKKGRDHVNSLRGIELEEHRKSNDRGNVTECSSDSSVATTYVQRRGRSGGSQCIERKWRRQLKIVLAIDAAICLTLLGVWLVICQGIECTRS
ncbi:Phytolongin Phyl1.2 [Cardamine amara subsp. amara]|uniref:Phytolongin Phyl1.2 n=1 Tax=Cardamine amara subsp. amara TaxID=228776 RepID=A0ABD1BY81_CARAN